ncbi:two-component response regulator [Vibrio sp. JCM 18904]|nr:two-component response regulator [Vibrio sp. JCM 18904]
MTSPPECKPVNILLVEDDDIDAMGIERALNTLKLLNPIYRARDGIEALECLRNGGEIPPLVLCFSI